ncbi:prolyl oligopeptidase family serine peptidase [Pseudoxanthomonas sp. PXM02]|uniref:alpha/beta hydrolase family protein n=1 Tax=Pseudoxanthomonas sp. PXM02 TaxID=2769294 RepID=UPI00177D1722|nr:prolyl oligopeptidase family serine peptidase [Pseudoxanthomonas sp. PXM02]MBD9478804.1 prolyl oligopeptidase family serine peptidase [Pseudoxanthomonas sp. PXM02]
MNLMARVVLAMILSPAVAWAQSVPSVGTFRFPEGGQTTYHEVVRGDASALDTLVFTYGGSGCADLGRYWLPTLADGLGIDARYVALNKRHVEKGAIGDGGGATCSAAFNQHNTPRQWMADYMTFISQTLEEQPQRWKKIVLVGGSEGGALAARVARARTDVTHLVVIGDGGWSMRENLSSLMGADVVEAAWKQIARHPDSADRTWLGHPYRYWFDTFDHVPLIDYQALEIPVLIAMGERDLSVPVASGHEVLRAANAAGKKNIGLVVYPGADHSLRADGRDYLPEFLRGAGQGIAGGQLD